MKVSLAALIVVAFASTTHYGVDAFAGVKTIGTTRHTCQSTTTLFAQGTQITMPALSSTMKEGRVVSWLKSEGDEISAGEAIMVVESDKADMDVEAFEDGFLAKIVVGEGEMAPVGQAVALIAETEADIPSVVASFEGGGAAPAATGVAEVPAATNGAFVRMGGNRYSGTFQFCFSHLCVLLFVILSLITISCFCGSRLRIQSNRYARAIIHDEGRKSCFMAQGGR
jgi:pyruvate dehydrogenase E2 component (dihydrolipoamide acetyltransferase)